MIWFRISSSNSAYTLQALAVLLSKGGWNSGAEMHIYP